MSYSDGYRPRLILEPMLWPTRVRVSFFFAWEKAKPGTMAACYGWNHPPLGLRDRETAFTVYQDGAGALVPVGWVSVTTNPLSPVLQVLSLGILPEYTGQGYRRRILMLASDWAFEHNGAEAVTAEVFDSNPDQQRAYLRDSERGFPFRYSGYVWYPQAYRMFTREKKPTP